jgi:hypothetical protein
MRSALLVAIAPVFTACSTTKVTVNYDRTLDFATFHTYSWARALGPAEAAHLGGRPQPAPDPLVAKQIVAAVDAELRKKGLTRVDARGDLEVHFQTNVSRGYDVASSGYGPRLGRGTAQLRAVGVGSLVVDLVDARKKELAWRAVASDNLDPEISPADRESRIAEVAEKIFRDFPPRP